MLLIELSGTASSLEFLTDKACPHFLLVVSGRTKGNQVGGSKFYVLIASSTERSHLRPGKWIERLCELLTSKGETGGRLFRRKLDPPRLYEFEFDFFRLLREVQSTTTEINKTIDVEDSFGILRSSRRGMTAHARNMGIPKDQLETFNRWSKGLSSTTGLPRLDMVETYSELSALKPLFLQITRSF